MRSNFYVDRLSTIAGANVRAKKKPLRGKFRSVDTFVKRRVCTH